MALIEISFINTIYYTTQTLRSIFIAHLLYIIFYTKIYGCIFFFPYSVANVLVALTKPILTLKINFVNKNFKKNFKFFKFYFLQKKYYYTEWNFFYLFVYKKENFQVFILKNSLNYAKS